MLRIIFLFQISILKYITSHQCLFPSVCKLDKVMDLDRWFNFGDDRLTFNLKYGLKCDAYNGFQFEYDPFILISNVTEYERCYKIYNKTNTLIEIKWPRDTSILEKRINMFNMLILFKTMFLEHSINFANLNGFDLNLINDDLKKSSFRGNPIATKKIFCVGCKIDFYLDQNRINTCEDILGSNESAEIGSFFQLYKLTFSPISDSFIDINLLNSRYITPLCPLVFNNSVIRSFEITSLVNTFYKKNVLTFSQLNSSKYVVNSDIKMLVLNKIQEIDLDLQLLNPLVFRQLHLIYATGSIRYIDKNVFKSFENLECINFETDHFRKIVHNSRIEWIKSINQNVKINMTGNIRQQVYNNGYGIKRIVLGSSVWINHEIIEDIFPEEDFCLYYDFPFEQLILMIYETYEKTELKKITCSFLWLVQYYKLYYINQLDNITTHQINNFDYTYHILTVLNQSDFNISLSNCFFPKMIDLCNKSKYSINQIWDTSDYMDLNETLKMAIKITSHLVSLVGIFTNLIVVITILHKKNKELFKEFKHYSYLWLTSAFSILIFLIQIFSWMSECFYPYEVFCPETRKSVFFQIFKMVFKECLVTSFRFMCSFTYVAFAFNRISLIGKDHGKFVEFFNGVGKKKYIGVCFIISCGFSVIKYFKYKINFDRFVDSFPISNEVNLSWSYWTGASNDAFFILNSIVDFLNYVVFEVLTSIIDVYMVVRLRKVLDEKFKKSESLIKDANKLENLKREHEGALKKATKMVVLNMAISILFRMPSAFIPAINVYAEFYYKSYTTYLDHPKFDLFYSFLIESGFYLFICELSDFFYTFSLSILLFVYLGFDKQFHKGFKCVFSSKEQQNQNK